MKPMYFHVSSSLTIILTLLLINRISAVKIPPSKPAKSKPIHDYIRKSCQVTLYKNLCFTSLSSRYKGPEDLGSLTQAAIKVSLMETKSVTSYLAAMNQTAGAKQALPAVQDCTKVLKTSIGHLRESLDLMEKLTKAKKNAEGTYSDSKKKQMKFTLSSVQTWMSAAITGHNTCMEGFNDLKMKDGDVMKGRLDGKVRVVRMLNSNSLALVNSYADLFR